MRLISELKWIVYESILYFLALIGPTLLLMKIGTSHPALSLIVAILGWSAAAVLFAFLIVITKRLFTADLEPGRYDHTDPKLRPWKTAIGLNHLLMSTPFWRVITTYDFLRYLYFKGMGAKIDRTCFIGRDVQILDPWGITAGRYVVFGHGAVIGAHKLEKGIFTYAPISIGKYATIGGRCIIGPGVSIGDSAVVSANSVVWAGSNILPGEVWTGNPATKMNFKLLRQVVHALARKPKV